MSSNYVLLILRSHKNLKSVVNSKPNVFLIASNQRNIIITTETVLPVRKNIPFILKSDEKLNGKFLQQV